MSPSFLSSSDERVAAPHLRQPVPPHGRQEVDAKVGHPVGDLDDRLAGAEVLQTMTFYASDDKLATVGLAGRVDELNRSAVQIARRVAALAGPLCS